MISKTELVFTYLIPWLGGLALIFVCFLLFQIAMIFYNALGEWIDKFVWTEIWK